MTATATLSSKFQISIPKAVRDEVHWKAGQEFVFIPKGKGVLVMPVPDLCPGPLWPVAEAHSAPSHVAPRARQRIRTARSARLRAIGASPRCSATDLLRATLQPACMLNTPSHPSSGRRTGARGYGYASSARFVSLSVGPERRLA